MPVNTTTSTSGGGTVTSFSNTPQAKDDTFNLTEDTVSLVATTDSSTIISLDVMANDGGGAAKSLYSIDDGVSASTATKVAAPIDLTKAETWAAGVSPWEPSGTEGIMIRLNALTGKVEMDLSRYLADHGWSSLQEMGPNDSIHESFTYAIRLANGTLSWATAEVHIVGTNDAADIGGQSSATLTETDTALETGGQLTITDVDGADAFIPQTDAPGLGGYGTFSIDADGTWTYQMNSAHNEFKAGVDYTDSIVVEAADGTTKTITVTIHGTNDAPALTGAQATLDDGTEEQQYTISEADLLAGYTDAEGDGLSVTDLSASNGTLVDNEDGTWTFTPDENFHGTVTLSYNVTDGTASVAATQTFGIVNVDDEATADLAIDGDAEEGSVLTASLTNIVDVDGAASATGYQWQEKIDGIWTDISGQTSQTLSVPDDQSYVGKEVRVIVTTTDSLSGQTQFTSDSETIANVEDEATGTVEVDGIAEEGGSLVADANGLSDEDGGIVSTTFQWQEKVGDSWEDIAGEDAATLSDGTTTTPNTASLAVDPVNDAPEVTPVDLGSINEDGSIIVSQAQLLAGSSDIDLDTLSVVNVSVASGEGSVVDNGDGTWTFTPDADWNGAVSLAYDVSDGTTTTPNTASLAVDPVNDAPEVTPVDLGSINEDGSIIVSQAQLLAGSSDIDLDTLSVVNVSVASGEGSVVDNGDGTWTFTPDADWNGAVSLAYDVSDGTTTTPNTASLAVDPVNDAPTVSLTNVVTSTPENGGVIKVADIVVTDIDGGTNELSLSGADAESFTIVGNELRFNGGANFEVKDSYDVTVNVDDASVGGNPDDSEGLTLAISDVVETVPASLPSTFNGTGDTNDFDLLNSGSTNGSATGLTLTGSNNGSNGDTMHGSNANDSINAQNGPDVVYGHGGNDTILGGNQGDTVYGQVGNDSLSGGADPDFIYGGSGTDLINGDGQADVIYGGSGRDTINGGGGPDTITGGFGDDVIDLGDSDGASDTIAYIDVLDTNDSITGFVSGTDKIDLSAIDSGDGDAAFNWGGQEAGPVVEANSVTWYTTGGNVVLLADTDGNLNTAEFSITLVGITSIVDSDVIL